MRLSSLPPRRFASRKAPEYPVLSAACAVAASAGCATQARPQAPTPTPAPTQVASAPSAAPKQPWTQPHTSRFPVDDEPLDLKRGYACGGDCPSPFELAAEDHERAMVQARVDYCVERAERVAPVPPIEFTVQAEIDRVGAPSKVEFQNADGVPDGVTACVKDLVQGARFVPPQGTAKSRRLWAYVGTHKKPDP